MEAEQRKEELSADFLHRRDAQGLSRLEIVDV
jgi:hypothetical protein